MSKKARKKKTKGAGSDDWFIIIEVGFFIIGVAGICIKYFWCFAVAAVLVMIALSSVAILLYSLFWIGEVIVANIYCDDRPPYRIFSYIVRVWSKVWQCFVSLVANILGGILGLFSSKPVARMSGVEFERYVGKKLREHGFTDVDYTPVSGDFGVDILAERNGRLYAFQCKRFSGSVGVKAVQEVNTGKAHYNADYAIVVTNSRYTPSAQELAQDSGVYLWNLETLDRL